MRKKRLIKKASPVDQSLTAISSDGRKILQMLENMKFKIEQSARILGNDPDSSKKIMQNSSMIDQIESMLYGICFNLENMDLIPSYNENQVQLNEGGKPDSEMNITEEEPEEENEEQKESEEPVEQESEEPEENEEESEEENEEPEEEAEEE